MKYTNALAWNKTETISNTLAHNNAVRTSIPKYTEGLYILYTTDGSNNLVKMGYSRNLKARLTDYMSMNPLAVILHVYAINGCKEVEEEYHFANKSLAKNEWYDVSKLEHMIGYIDGLVAHKNTKARVITLAEAIESKVLREADKSFLRSLLKKNKSSWTSKQIKYKQSLERMVGSALGQRIRF